MTEPSSGKEQILNRIAKATRLRVIKAKELIPQKQLLRMLYEDSNREGINNRVPNIFEAAIKLEGISFICEVKKASPSKGIIAEEFPYIQIAKEYEMAGADAISVLTEPYFFLGRNEYLTEIRKEVNIPVLRKDFILDEYQLYEAAIIGADAVLLICSLLGEETLKHYLELCRELGLAALVETHTEAEVRMAIQAGAKIIGVNNRNLNTFHVDLQRSLILRSLVPKEVLFVAESGIKTRDDIKRLEEAGVNAVLIGEALMIRRDKRKALEQLRES